MVYVHFLFIKQACWLLLLLLLLLSRPILFDFSSAFGTIAPKPLHFHRTATAQHRENGKRLWFNIGIKYT